ncbi:MAG: Na+/H+ antiporter subunit G [Bacteroidota bacterium]|nr:Na+/H+ antiporter subunit G [Kiloniellaceae bacterium]
MDFLVELLISVLIVIGAVFGLVGSYGLAKLPNLMTRLHSPTKSSTLGVGAVLLASIAYVLWHESALSLHELVITLFVFLTAPISANFIAKAYLHRHRDTAGELPPTGTDHDWATFDAPPAAEDAEPDTITALRDRGA